jgi:ribosomal protein S12 methylthiotransferase accessory factor
MSIRVRFPGGKRVDAEFDGYVVRTDQPISEGGTGLSPSPFDLFLASLATCAGFYVLGFCRARGIPVEGVEIVQHHHFDDSTHRLERLDLEIVLPPNFPEKYRMAIAKAADACKVKKTLLSPPEIAIVTRFDPAAPAPPHEHQAA